MIRPSPPFAFGLPFALGLLLVGGCDQRRSDDQPVVVSAIGGPARPGDPSRGALDLPQRLLMDATAQGLVRFGADGGVEPGLAERWIVIDDGRSYIFRLREAEWADGTPVTAERVVAVLNRAASPRNRNPLQPYLAVIEEAVEMTPQVIEVRLKRPRPDLLKLFAQPELAIFQTRTLAGSGPLRVQGDAGPGLLLRPAFDPRRIADAEFEEPGPERFVRLHGERAARAVARFLAGQSDLVLGGTYADWPIVNAAGVAPANLRLDPAPGLFGLRIANRRGFLASPENRAALAMAIDRAALTAAVRPEWAPIETLLPAQLDSAKAPALPEWQSLDLAQRRALARDRVAAWRRANPATPIELRVALPPGPGSSLIWEHIVTGLRSIGIAARWVAPDQPAELRLIDRVAPYDGARWFLVNACQPCAADSATLIVAARDAPNLEARAHRIAEAEAALAQDSAFIPIAQPLRWSIVALRLTAWQGNPRAWHPLNRLRSETE